MKQLKLADYLAWDYDVKIIRIDDGDEYEYKAYADELGEYAIYGVGKTKSEAIASFEETRQEIFQYYYENNIPIHKPERKKVDMPSGKFVVRTSPSTHLAISKLAKKNEQSLNQYINALMERDVTGKSIAEESKKEIKAVGQKAKDTISKCPYSSMGSYTMDEESVRIFEFESKVDKNIGKTAA